MKLTDFQDVMDMLKGEGEYTPEKMREKKKKKAEKKRFKQYHHALRQDEIRIAQGLEPIIK